MKKSILITIGIIVIVILFIGGIFVSDYNNMVTSREAIDTALANIDTQLQRRADLIPNLVSTVKGYASHETEVITQITEAREKMVNASSTSDKMVANAELTTALNTLNVIVENYPDLKSSENYINLFDELAGTENRIAVARKDYNTAVQNYNNLIVKFPNNLLAEMFDFEKATYFETDEDGQEVPSVNFD